MAIPISNDVYSDFAKNTLFILDYQGETKRFKLWKERCFHTPFNFIRKILETLKLDKDKITKNIIKEN